MYLHNRLKNQNNFLQKFKGLDFILLACIFLLGFIGEYVMNILVQTRNQPLVIEKERINF